MACVSDAKLDEVAAMSVSSTVEESESEAETEYTYTTESDASESESDSDCSVSSCSTTSSRRRRRRCIRLALTHHAAGGQHLMLTISLDMKVCDVRRLVNKTLGVPLETPSLQFGHPDDKTEIIVNEDESLEDVMRQHSTGSRKCGLLVSCPMGVQQSAPTQMAPPVLAHPHQMYTNWNQMPAYEQQMAAVYAQTIQLMDQTARESKSQQEILGDHLYQYVAATRPSMAGKITGMLLELEDEYIVQLLEDHESLETLISQAAEMLGGDWSDEKEVALRSGSLDLASMEIDAVVSAPTERTTSIESTVSAPASASEPAVEVEEPTVEVEALAPAAPVAKLEKSKVSRRQKKKKSEKASESKESSECSSQAGSIEATSFLRSECDEQAMVAEMVAVASAMQEGAPLPPVAVEEPAKQRAQRSSTRRRTAQRQKTQKSQMGQEEKVLEDQKINAPQEARPAINYVSDDSKLASNDAKLQQTNSLRSGALAAAAAPKEEVEDPRVHFENLAFFLQVQFAICSFLAIGSLGSLVAFYSA